MKGTKSKISSCVSLSWPIYLLPPPTAFKCSKCVHSHLEKSHGGSLKKPPTGFEDSECVHSQFEAFRGFLMLEWEPPEGVTLFCVGLMEFPTSRILRCIYTEHSSCTVDIDNKIVSKQTLMFKCFVYSCGDEKHISSEKVLSNEVFIHLADPLIQHTDFDHSESKLSLIFKGDDRASHFLLKYTLSYYTSNSISTTKTVEQKQDGHEEQQKCFIHFEKTMLDGCKSIRVSLQAVGGGSFISSLCQEIDREGRTALVKCKYISFVFCYT